MAFGGGKLTRLGRAIANSPLADVDVAVNAWVDATGELFNIACGIAVAMIPSSSFVATGESPPGPVPPDCRAGVPLAFTSPSGSPAKVPRRLPLGCCGGPAIGTTFSDIKAPEADDAVPPPLRSGGGAIG